MTRRLFQTLTAVLALTGAPALLAQSAGSETYGLRLSYRQWLPTLSGEIQDGTADREGTLLDLVDDLGVDAPNTFEIDGQIRIRSGQKLRGSFTRIDYDGDVSVRRTFRYDDSTFLNTSRVLTSIKGGGYYTLDYEYDLVKRPTGYLGVVLGGKMLDVDSVLVAPVEGVREQRTLRAVLPAVGLVGRGYLGRLSIEGEIAGLSIGERGRVIEAKGSIQLHLSDRLGLIGGYRHIELRAQDGPDRLKMTVGGWHFGAELNL